METPNPSCAARATLDPDQLAAVTTDAPRTLVLAGAGSGKTRALTERIAYLIEECHASPSEIVAVTFTRKAAAEMRERLVKRIGNKAYGVTMGTMHALALVQLRRFGELIGLRPDNITVYNEWEESFLLRTVAQEVGALKGKTWKVPKKAVDAAFSTFYSTGIDPAEFDPACNLFNVFMARCRENNALTYGGLLTGFMLLLPKVMGYLGWRHVLVDEVQDLDRLQWGLIEAMAAGLPASLFAVGDIDQSIYAWRGAAPEYLVENVDSFKVLRLERNYRSGHGIVEAANRLIANNTARLPKTMKTCREGSNLRVAPGMDSAAICAMVRSIIPATGLTYDLAVLARKHVLLQSVARELDALEIPYLYVGQKAALTNTEEFRRFHAFLKLLVNPYDNFAFLLVREALGVSDDEFAIVRSKAIRDDQGHLRAWLTTATGVWMEFFQKHDYLSDVLRASADCDVLQTLRPPVEVVDFIDAYCAGRPLPERTVSAYLSWLATYDVQDEIPADDPDGPGVVTLATIHGSKGLEWPYVILAGCNEGILPSDRAVKSGDLEEERRLAYVAITRARDCLTLAVRPERAEKPGRDGQMQVYVSPVSRFVGEAMGSGGGE